jgi:uncharacterized protein
MAELTLIVKATRLCNLRCVYCHDWRAGAGQTMQFPMLARTVAAALRDPVADVVQFIWHGGEPTILPIDFYRKALFLQSRFAREGQAVGNSLQTNATRLTPAWCQFLSENEFSVSLSLDGSPELHDAHRPHISGRGSWCETMRGVTLLRDHGVPFSVLMVVDERALTVGPSHLFDYFLALGIKNYGLIPATPANGASAAVKTLAPHYVNPTRWSRFLCALYDRWIAHGDCAIRIRELDALISRLRDQAPACCTLAGHCLGRYYMVEPDGDVAHCDVFVGDKRYVLGNVSDIRDFSAFHANPHLAALRAENTDALAAMRHCAEFGVCNGWCPHQRYLSVRHDPDHVSDCCGLREAIAHIRAGEMKRSAPSAKQSAHATG